MDAYALRLIHGEGARIKAAGAGTDVEALQQQQQQWQQQQQRALLKHFQPESVTAVYQGARCAQAGTLPATVSMAQSPLVMQVKAG
jgi:hypothetical protein